MKHSDLNATAAKLEAAKKTFEIAFAAVEPKWTDAARRDFQETYLTPMDAKVRSMGQAITRLAGLLADAERQCGDSR